jgi:hypothetical protein
VNAIDDVSGQMEFVAGRVDALWLQQPLELFAASVDVADEDAPSGAHRIVTPSTGG